MPKTPYAGLTVIGELDAPMATSWAEDLLIFLKMHGVKSVEIRMRPGLSTFDQPLIHQALVSAKFQPRREINHHVTLQSTSIILHKMQTRRIKKCKEMGFTFQQEPHENKMEVYDFLVKCRTQQNLNINIGQQQFEQVLNGFPNQYLIYSIRDTHQQLAACTIIIYVNNKVVYNYLPGFDRRHAELSPLAYLQSELYILLKTKNFETFDLGISSINGEIQEGLASFKERMGATRTKRYSYLLQLT